MIIPESVRIGSMDYKVIITDEILLVNHEECYGKIEYGNHAIKIKKDFQDVQGMESTLLHEIMHGITHERNFVYDRNDDETITQQLAKGLHQLIKDNPNMFLKG